jgi:hypothetical protein
MPAAGFMQSAAFDHRILHREPLGGAMGMESENSGDGGRNYFRNSMGCHSLQ